MIDNSRDEADRNTDCKTSNACTLRTLFLATKQPEKSQKLATVTTSFEGDTRKMEQKLVNIPAHFRRCTILCSNLVTDFRGESVNKWKTGQSENNRINQRKINNNKDFHCAVTSQSRNSCSLVNVSDSWNIEGEGNTHQRTTWPLKNYSAILQSPFMLYQKATALTTITPKFSNVDFVHTPNASGPRLWQLLPILHAL